MRIIVTGAAGFIGSHLVDKLLAEDCGNNEVIAIDNELTGGWQNLTQHNDDSRLTVIPGDIVKIDRLRARKIFSRYGFERIDQIYNLACPASPVHYQADPIHTWKTSVIGSMNMLDIAEYYSARILQASTSEVYGDPLVHPQPEEYWGNVNPCGPRSCYDEGKRAAESLFFDYHRHRSVDVRVVRIFNTYGPRMAPDDGRVVSNFIVQALRGEPLTIYGDGRQTRSFCYIDDLVEGIHALMNQSETNGPINLGNPHEFTILELAEAVREMTGYNSDIVFRPLPKDDPTQRKPVIDRAKNVLGWQPHVQLKDGIARTIAHFRDTLKDLNA